MSDRYMRECIKKRMREYCAELGIEIPENATKKQLEAVFDAYNKDAVVVNTKSGVAFRQTDKPTEEYTVEFTISGYHVVRAENEEAAREWVEQQCAYNYNPGKYEYADITDWEIGESYKNK